MCKLRCTLKNVAGCWILLVVHHHAQFMQVSVLPKPLPLRLAIPTQVAGDLLRLGLEWANWRWSFWGTGGIWIYTYTIFRGDEDPSYFGAHHGGFLDPYPYPYRPLPNFPESSPGLVKNREKLQGSASSHSRKPTEDSNTSHIHQGMSLFGGNTPS